MGPAPRGHTSKGRVKWQEIGHILKGSVLREIGFDFNSITEDFRFAMELCKRGYKTWHSSTKVSIKSANSIRFCETKGQMV